MIPLAWEEIEALDLGRLERGDDGALVTAVVADSRAAGPGDLFVALNTGIRFVDDARARGAATLVPRDQESALAALSIRWETLGIAERSLAIAREAVELARGEYRLGARTFEQLQQSVKSEADARRQLIQARYGFVDALLDLEAAVGGTVRDIVR